VKRDIHRRTQARDVACVWRNLGFYERDAEHESNLSAQLNKQKKETTSFA
jgi:hypothetical protein